MLDLMLPHDSIVLICLRQIIDSYGTLKRENLYIAYFKRIGYFIFVETVVSLNIYIYLSCFS